MLQIKISNVVDEIVKQVLLNSIDSKEEESRQFKGLYINLDLRMSYYTDSKSYDQSRGLHLLYHRHSHMANVTVFRGVTESPFGRIDEVYGWKHETTHDSCWRDRIFSDIYFKMARLINEELVMDNLTKVAPILMTEGHNFRGGLFNWIPVKVSKDPTDDNNYRQLVEIVKV